MNRDLTNQETETLEKLIDVAGLTAVLETLSSICDAKADHIRSSYNDKFLARKWDEACGICGIASTNIRI